MTSTEREAADDDDLDALEKAVVDGSTVSIGLWLTYVLVLFYLAIATFGVTHRDLFLENSVKLPFLNVDLPLSVYFTLGPTLFVFLHAYVLIHFSLLAAKIRTLNSELQRKVSDPAERALIRRRLPINILVQVLAGPHEVRKGFLGFMLRLIMGISLIVAPILLLLLFQLQFLPYHDQYITWWHRIMVALDLVLLWLLWSSIAHGKLWAHVAKPKSATLEVSSEPTLDALCRGRLSDLLSSLGRALTVPKIATTIVVLFFLKIATFPGEWLQDEFPSLGMNRLQKFLVAGEFDPGSRTATSIWSNVLILPSVDVIDHSKFDTEDKISKLPVTVSLRVRHLERAILYGAKLRKADFTGATLEGARLDQADLREAKFDCGDLFRDEENLRECTRLEGASLKDVQLQGASLWSAGLEGSDLRGANFDGAQLLSARLLGANLSGAHLRAAMLDSALLQGADLSDSHLQNAWLTSAQLQGAKLDRAHLNGALLDGADLAGASLDRADVQGASFMDIIVWRTRVSTVSGKVRTNVETDPKKQCLKTDKQGKCTSILADALSSRFEDLKRKITSDVPDGEARQRALGQLNRLDPKLPEANDDTISQDWTSMKTLSFSPSDYPKELITQLQTTGCSPEGRPYVLQQIIDQLDTFPTKGVKLPDLVQNFLSDDCFGSQGISADSKLMLKYVQVHGTSTP